jgi:hypothetical protein
MKKFKLITAISLILMISGIVVIHSCKKEKETTGNPNENSISAQDIKINKMILNFREKMNYSKQHPEFKSGENLSVDSARWYLDAVFNYSYAFTEESFTSFNTDTFTIVLNKTDEMINMEDVFAAFVEQKDKTLEIYYATEGEQKELYVSYLEITHNNPEEAVIKTTATIGVKNTSTPPGFSEWGPFAEGDDWMYGELLGDCYGNYQWETDAATEIEDATNTYRYKYIQDQGIGWYAYYTEPSAEVTVTVYGNPAPYQLLLRNPNDGTIDNYRDYLLMYQQKDLLNGLVVETCIPWTDMNFYYQGTHKVIYHIIQENDDVFGVNANLTFYYCTMEGKGIEGTIEDPNYAHHEVTVSYKTRHISDIIERISINE